MPSCAVCNLIIHKSICQFNKATFHLECCKFCKPEEKPKEKQITQGKAGPGRLKFDKINTFSDTKADVLCHTCKKKIVGQKYLTHKVGEFDCKECFSKRVELCSKCKEPFESGEEVFKDEDGGKFCDKCFKELNKDKKKEKKEEPIKKTIHCDKCTEHVESADMFDYKGLNYHKKCFCCVHCKKTLESKEFYKDEKENPHCIDCYTKLFCKKCDKCSNGIAPNQSGVKFDDKNYHKDCFACLKCHTKIPTDSDTVKSDNTKYFKADNQPCCADCFGKHYCKGCTKCSKGIMPGQKGLLFENSNYHTDCFCCTNCSHKLPVDSDKPKADGSKFYKNDKNQPFCIDCYGKLYCKPCTTCSKGVMPNQVNITFDDKSYHKECFKCHSCKTELVTESDKGVPDSKKFAKGPDSHPYCIECYGKNFCKQCESCNKAILPGQTAAIFENKNHYHKECFSCKFCNTKLLAEGANVKSDGNKIFKTGDNKPCCPDCYAKNFCHKCDKCTKGILPGQTEIIFEDKYFHKEHFCCHKCSKSIAADSDKIKADNVKFFKAEGNHPYCADCYGKYMCKQCVNPKCSKPIMPGQTAVILDDTHYHKECFCCNNCSHKIDVDGDHPSSGSKFYKGDKDQKPYCIECYSKLFCKQCDKCSTGILPNQTGLAYDNGNYHKDCFCCTKCSTNFITDADGKGGKIDPNKILKDDKKNLYCPDCYGKQFCKQCEKCTKSILPNQKRLSFDEKPYHKECFSCDNCSHKIIADTDSIKSDNSKFFRTDKGKPCCHDCFTKLYCKKCEKCSKFVMPTDVLINFDEHNYHGDCFCCNKCSKKLAGSSSEKIKSDNVKYFKVENARPCCPECFGKHYCKQCDKCSKPIFPNQQGSEHDKKHYHRDCVKCQDCSAVINFSNEKFEQDDKKNFLCHKCMKKKGPNRGMAGPGRLKFENIGNFENTNDVMCENCKKKIVGQKFLTHKVGKFICKECYSKNLQTDCFVCKKPFESREELFKDDKDNMYCVKCFKAYEAAKKGL